MATPSIRRICGLLAALVAAAALLPAAGAQQPAAQPSQISFFGMNTYFTGLERNERDGEGGVATLIARGRQLGVRWAREELSWGNLERNGKGRWSWQPFDGRLRAAADAGYGIIGMLLTTPAWARVDDCAARQERFAAAGVRAENYWCPPASTADFADYVRAVVERYDGDGQADAPGSPRVAAWQIWNEPNAWETWPGSPAEFAALLQAGYAAAKQADPSSVVAVGGLYVFDGQWNDGVGHGDGLRFLDEAIAANPAAWASFDALAVHPYMPDVAPDQPGIYGAVTLVGRLRTARRWLDERAQLRGGPPRPLWISEVGWSTCAADQADCHTPSAAPTGAVSEADAQRYLAPDWRGALGPSAAATYPGVGSAARAAAEPAALIGKSEEQQANYLVKAHGLALALGVQHMSWFQLEDKFDGGARNFWEEAAILRTAAEGYAPKPAAGAYAAMARILAGATFLGPGPLHTYAHVDNGPAPVARFNLRFLAADGAIVDLIWRNSGAEELSLPLEPGRAAGLLARNGGPAGLRVENGLARFAVGETPVYLVQQPLVSGPHRLYLPVAGR